MVETLNMSAFFLRVSEVENRLLGSGFISEEATINRPSKTEITLSRLVVGQQRLIIIHLSPFKELFENLIRTKTMPKSVCVSF